jgi:hypothetical protein
MALPPAPGAAQSLLDRVQGLYYPPNRAAGIAHARHGWRRGGRQGDTLHGVENACTLTNAFPIPGMDAMMFDLACSGEGRPTMAARSSSCRRRTGSALSATGS